MTNAILGSFLAFFVILACALYRPRRTSGTWRCFFDRLIQTTSLVLTGAVANIIGDLFNNLR